MQALKALVIIMGVLILIGTMVVVVTIYNRVTKTADRTPAEDTPRAGASAPPATFGETSVPIPDGCRVVEMVPSGDRLLLRLGSVERCNRILVIDLRTGSQLGGIVLSTQE